MIGTLTTAITFLFKVCNNSSAVVFNTVIYVKVNTDGSLTSQRFEIVILNLLKNLEVRDCHCAIFRLIVTDLLLVEIGVVVV